MNEDGFNRLVALTLGAGALLALAWLYARGAAAQAEIDWLESIPVLQPEE